MKRLDRATSSTVWDVLEAFVSVALRPIQGGSVSDASVSSLGAGLRTLEVPDQGNRFDDDRNGAHD